MDIQRSNDKRNQKKKVDPPKEKNWDNPKNPEGTEDRRDIEQLERQMEEAKRRKENLTEDDNENN